MSRADGEEIPSLAASSKRLGVLAFLALRRPRGSHRRDTLLSLFWPDSDEQRARGSLRTLLSSLRREVGHDTLVTRGEEVALSDEGVWCDAVAFEDALDGGDLEGAMELYHGPLLPGFHPGGAPELEQWVDERRAQMARRATEAAWELCRRAEAEGDPDAAIGWARRAMELQPHDERGIRRLLALLESVGDRAGALREYEAFARRLRAEYELEPSAETAALVDALRAEAGEVPARLEALPSDRRASPEGRETGTGSGDVGDFGVVGDTAVAPGGREVEPPAAPRRRFPRRVPLLLAGAALVMVGVALFGRTSHASTSLDASRVAVFPFSVSGASPSLSYLRQGMVDLLASDLSGRSGPRAVEPGVAVAAWQAALTADGDSTLDTREALPVAARLGAGLTALGEVVGTPTHIVLDVKLVDVRSGNTVTRARVSGATDSLAVLADQLAGKLLAGTAGAADLSDDVLAATPLPALRSYLEGLQAYRRGRFTRAASLLETSLDQDSTFAEAALALAMAGSWGVDPAPLTRGLRLAWASADRLSPGDRALVHALGPAPGTSRNTADHLQAWQRAVEANPDRAEAWYGFGDVLLHWGALLGRMDARNRAFAALSRSAALRPGFAAPYDHLVELDIDRGDTAAAAARLRTFLSADSGAPIADYLRWRLALAEHDTRSLASIRERMDSIPTASLIRIVGMGVLDAVGLRDVQPAADALEKRPGAPGDRAGWLYLLAAAALDQGHPAEAARLFGRYGEIETIPGDAQRVTVLSGLYSDGDTVAARTSYRTLARGLADGDEGRGPPDPVAREVHVRDVCVTGEWTAWHGDLAAADGARRTLRSAARSAAAADPYVSSLARQCAEMVGTIAAVVGGRPNARTLLASADSIQAEGDFVQNREYFADVALARLHERLGDLRGALQAVRRRPYHYWFSLGTLATALRIEGRLAERLGERSVAIAADRRYLILRAAPDRRLEPQAETVRRRLAALEKQATEELSHPPA